MFGCRYASLGGCIEILFVDLFRSIIIRADDCATVDQTYFSVRICDLLLWVQCPEPESSRIDSITEFVRVIGHELGCARELMTPIS